VGALVLFGASLSWATGSVWSKKLPLPPSPFLAAAMEMLAGGALMALVGLAAGEAGAVAQPSARSVAAFFYLIVFGSLLGFTAFVWLLGATTPARASTYAFVNPVVAVFLGWAVAAEPVGPRTLAAAAVIVAAVALILWEPRRA
jgi:drug/metabolite transporter (DMT)-like permease